MSKYTININILILYILSILTGAQVNIFYFIVKLLLEYEVILLNVTHTRWNDADDAYNIYRVFGLYKNYS